MTPIERHDLSSQVYDILRARITTLQIKPGERIDIATLSKELSVSPIPIREALKRLTERGLVRFNPGLSYHAIELSDKDIQDIFAFRKLVEVFALQETIVKIPQAELEGLRNASLKLLGEDLPMEELRVRFDETDKRLHQELIINNSNNRFVRSFYDVMEDLIAIVRHLNQRIESAIREHLEIVDALQKRDFPEAQWRLCQHLDNSKEGCPPVSWSKDAHDGEDTPLTREESSIKAGKK